MSRGEVVPMTEVQSTIKSLEDALDKAIIVKKMEGHTIAFRGKVIPIAEVQSTIKSLEDELDKARLIAKENASHGIVIPIAAMQSGVKSLEDAWKKACETAEESERRAEESERRAKKAEDDRIELRKQLKDLQKATSQKADLAARSTVAESDDPRILLFQFRHLLQVAFLERRALDISSKTGTKDSLERHAAFHEYFLSNVSILCTLTHGNVKTAVVMIRSPNEIFAALGPNVDRKDDFIRFLLDNFLQVIYFKEQIRRRPGSFVDSDEILEESLTRRVNNAIEELWRQSKGVVEDVLAMIRLEDEAIAEIERIRGQRQQSLSHDEGDEDSI